jgi:hypothetical protein
VFASELRAVGVSAQRAGRRRATAERSKKQNERKKGKGNGTQKKPRGQTAHQTPQPRKTLILERGKKGGRQSLRKGAHEDSLF